MGKSRTPSKPYILRRWRLDDNHFYTCARPGRTGDPKTKAVGVPDDIVHRWVLGLPGPQTVIVSLLGCKPNGQSEFGFYSFHGRDEHTDQSSRSVSFSEWLRRSQPGVELREHPTLDFNPVPAEQQHEIAQDVLRLIADGRTVVIVDSGGQQRSVSVCAFLGAVEDSATS